MSMNTRFVPRWRLPCAGALAALLLGLAAANPASAAGRPQGKDCAPVGSLPGYAATSAPEITGFASEKFHVRKNDQTMEQEVRGHYCTQHYTFRGKGDPMSELEAQMNYREQFTQLGAKVVYTWDAGNGEGETVATLDKAGKTYWLRSNGGTDIAVAVLEEAPFVATLMGPSGSDYPLLGHMPNYAMQRKPTTRHYDQSSFRVTDGGSSQLMKVQGAYWDATYARKQGAAPISALESQLNYVAALKKLGAQILYTWDEHQTDARLDHNGQIIWFEISYGNDDVHVTVVEEKPFKASIKPADAGALKAALDKDGHVALYINFDFDKATLRPDAAPVIAQVVALLKANPGLKVSIQGNTDNVGSHDYNVKLSQARAATVVTELVKQGIATARLTAVGNGPDKPVADNDSSDGRARNRRVELVKV